MNITKLTIPEAVSLLKTPNVEMHYLYAGSRFTRIATGTIDLFRYAAWLVDDKPRPVGRQRQFSQEEQKEKKRKADLERVNAATRAANDIGEIPFETIDWERRSACKNDQILFEKTYLPMVCEKPNAPYHLLLINAITETIRNGGKQAILLPRGGAKTTKCRAGFLHGGLYGRIRWGYNISANEDKAIETLETLKTWLQNSPLLLEDFPEICFPISILKTKHTGSVAESQSYRGTPTKIVWARDEVRFPCLKLPEETALWYAEHDPESVRKIILTPNKPEDSFWMPTACGTILTTDGINSAIRGGNIPPPLTLETIRPNFAILDDVQNDQSAASVTTVRKLDKIIANAIRFLPKPGEPIAILMPCTVIESHDLADTYGNPELKPEWRGIRVPMVTKWPDGMDDKAITQETETSRLWTQYAEIRRQSIRKHGDIRDATAFYELHQTLMDSGFTVSWPERFDPGEISAIQNAMNLRFENHRAFLSNMQQIGADLLDSESGRIRWQDFAEKTLDLERGTIPANAQRLVAYVDIQAEYFAYVVLAVNFDFSCCYVADYGTFPQFGVQHYRRRQANDWRLLTKSYLATRNIASGAEKVNLDDIYTWGLRTLLDDLISRKYVRADENNSELLLSHIAMDAQEGLISPIVRDVCKKYPPEKVIAYHGFGITGGRMGMETYTPHDDTTFEDIRNPSANARRWMFKFSKVSRTYELHSDVNAWKDYLVERIRTPKGERGSLTLFNAPQHEHELFAVQICESERSELYTSRGVTRNRWTVVPGADNEFFDCLVGCFCLASFAGCVYVPTIGIRLENTRPPKQKKTFRERLEERKRKRGT
ncbi:MAG: phage terminase large subunit family protein [Planctomycetia bacterium]|nr:phage terminase large subunit family protein [Planctomycetia bacterium]